MNPIFHRTSVRSFADRPVEPEKTEAMLRAAMQAPSTANQQPWEFYVVTDRETLRRLSVVTPFAGPAADAPSLIVSAYRTDCRLPDWAQIDLAIAMENLWLAADELGLGGVWLGIAPLEDRMRAVEEILGMPENLRAFALFPYGYPAEARPQPDRFDPARIHWDRQAMDDFRIEQALLFAADWFRRTGHNPGKPVFLHSLRVARACETLGYGEDTVLTALLHDLIEDTDCQAQDIEAAFGASIARAVLALTDDAAIDDRLRRSLDSIARCAALGPEALVVRCLDAADNCRFFHLADKATQAYLCEKYRHLYAACAPFAALAPAREALLRQMRAQGIAPEKPS